MSSFPRKLLSLSLCLILVRAFDKTRFPSLATNLAGAAPSEANWSSITPSENISWTPCLTNFQCARLSVPLDFATPNGPKAVIALQMLPAANGSTSRGTILLNPGGPGGSGTQFITQYHEQIRNLTGSDFALLGFDPRGLGASTPTANCFDSELEYDAWAQSEGGPLLAINVSDGSIPLARSQAQAIGELCASKIAGNGTEDPNASAEAWGIGRFMDTAAVARDMRSIIDKLGESKLTYYGVSYGTMLGQYFAALFPDRVGHMVLDGVLDGENAQALEENSLLVNADDVLASFFTFCHAAGPDNCPVYESSPEAIRARYDRIISGVKARPVAVPFAPGGPAVITYPYLGYQIFQALYTPITSFPALAESLLALETRNQTGLASIAYTGSQAILQQCSSGVPTPFWDRTNQATTAVTCSDGPAVNDTDREFDAYLQNATATSKVIGPFLSQIRLDCDEWTIRAKARYTGPVASDNTSSPILFVSSTYDPVCPLSSAQRVQKRFKGSGLLIQKSYGHTATLASLSPCTYNYVRQYLVNGTLPKEGTVCPPGPLPFGAPSNTTA